VLEAEEEERAKITLFGQSVNFFKRSNFNPLEHLAF